jgi:1L-myo-inositol 1-phosphate cytidylyltransferase / CDP-L-myo-inositol myo-inositolphosphotransferase
MFMDQTIPQERKTASKQGLKTAIVVTATGVFSRTAGSAGGAGPLTVVGGLPLFVRTVLTLQRAGLQEIVVLAGAEEPELARLLRDDPRVTVAVRWRPVREFPPDDHRTWDTLAREMNGPCLIVGSQMVLTRPLIDALGREAEADLKALTVVCDGHATEIAVLPPSLMSVSAAIRGEGPPVRVLLGRAQARGRVTAVETSAQSSCWCLHVHDAAEAKVAEQMLFQSLRGPYEGFVDTYFNRAVSARLSRVFLFLRLSPNAVTMVATAVGVCAAAAFSTGSYAAGIAGALLFQLAAIVDCCDGEIARLTFTESPFGERLDILTDNIVHMAIFAGIGWGAFVAQGGWQNAAPRPWLPLALGGAAVFANAMSLWLVTRAKAIRNRQGWRKPEQSARVEFILKNMASRDFSVILLFFAAIGKLTWFLWMTAIGANIFWIMLAWTTRPSAIARA